MFWSVRCKTWRGANIGITLCKTILPSSTMAALIVCLMERIPTTIAISFLQTSTLAAVDRSTSRQSPKVARHRLLVVVHAVWSRPIETLKLRGTAVVNLSGAILCVATVFSRQTAVKILRRVNRFAEGFIVADVIGGIRVSLGGKRRVDVVTSFETATQMFPQPLSYATSTSSLAILSTVGVASLVSATGRIKLHWLRLNCADHFLEQNLSCIWERERKKHCMFVSHGNNERNVARVAAEKRESNKT